MEKRIYKYPLTDLSSYISMPTGARILSVQLQGNDLMAWALIDKDVPTSEKRCFAIYGTGWALDNDPGDYLATIQGNGFVWHLFETTRAREDA